MRKLTKQNLDELAKTMNVIPEQEQRSHMGMYIDDCFWRCVAYILEGRNDEEAAEIYAQSYYAKMFAETGNSSSPYYVEQYLRQYGAGMDTGSMMSYVASHSDLIQRLRDNQSALNLGSEAGFMLFNPGTLSFYEDKTHLINGTPAGHCVIFQGWRGGRAYFYDPQANFYFDLSAQEFSMHTKVTG
jgi:hypothetical protein